MFRFDKTNPLVQYNDIRKLEKWSIPQRENFCIDPDDIVDFRNMPYDDKSYKMVVFDPPHLTNAWDSGRMAKKYGKLDRASRKDDLTKWFNECRRILDDYGVLVFKWNEEQVKLSEVLPLFHTPPLFWHTTGTKNKTKWMVFMKTPLL